MNLDIRAIRMKDDSREECLKYTSSLGVNDLLLKLHDATPPYGVSPFRTGELTLRGITGGVWDGYADVENHLVIYSPVHSLLIYPQHNRELYRSLRKFVRESPRYRKFIRANYILPCDWYAHDREVKIEFFPYIIRTRTHASRKGRFSKLSLESATSFTLNLITYLTQP